VHLIRTFHGFISNGTKVAIAISEKVDAPEEARGGFKMRVRLSIILLLVIALATIVVGQQPVINDGPSPAGQEKVKLTPEEEREALGLAAQFNERLRATNDFGQIIDEMFVPKFRERLRQTSQDSLPLAFLDKSLIGSVNTDELRRYYVASMNFYQLYFRLYEVAGQLRKQSESDKDDPELEEVLSPEVINVLLSNSITAGWIKEDLSDEHEKEGDNNSQLAEGGDSTPAAQAAPKTDNDGAEEESEIGIIKRLSRLNDASATFEKANQLMRQRLMYLPIIAPVVSGNSEEENESDSPKPNPANLDKGEFGLPKGTRVIHLDTIPFCLSLIKIDGRLKILSVSLYVD
jgi:hypothetical protein